MSEEKLFCLTLDLENDWYFDEPGYDHLTLEYLDDFIELIQGLDVPLSVFVVGKTLEKYSEEVDRLANELDCEFHLHSYQHDTSKNYDFREEVCRGIDAFQAHFGDEPIGYRAPQGNIEKGEFAILEEEGFTFDSSIFPSYRPGKYFNLDEPIKPYHPSGVNELIEIPIGAFPGIRIPISHSYFKFFGRPLTQLLSISSLPDVIVYNLHLQDIYKTASHDQLQNPKRLFMKRNLDNSESILAKNISKLRYRGYEPAKISEVIGL